jgi:hypothetical protein
VCDDWRRNVTAMIVGKREVRKITTRMLLRCSRGGSEGFVTTQTQQRRCPYWEHNPRPPNKKKCQCTVNLDVKKLADQLCWSLFVNRVTAVERKWFKCFCILQDASFVSRPPPTPRKLMSSYQQFLLHKSGIKMVFKTFLLLIFGFDDGPFLPYFIVFLSETQHKVLPATFSSISRSPVLRNRLAVLYPS